MNWHYTCPLCGSPHWIAWKDRTHPVLCGMLGILHRVPEPAAEPTAWVDSPRWPVEMELAVTSMRGVRCTTPGCGRRYSTLVHREPYRHGGRTSVANLVPMCLEHAPTTESAQGVPRPARAR